MTGEHLTKFVTTGILPNKNMTQNKVLFRPQIAKIRSAEKTETQLLNKINQ